jgi:Na+-translocating ferredoxin:NAD+ oxidoreductase RNF subunit RnfB
MFEKYPLGRRISKDEALRILAKAEEEGLVHNTFNAEEESMFICNCCTCCCGIIQAVKASQLPHMLAKSSFIAHIDQESCAMCGVCADERCPVDAIIQENGAYKVLDSRCIGCGVCTPTCPTESITLLAKPETQQVKPPGNIVDWNLARAASRGIEIKIA